MGQIVGVLIERHCSKEYPHWPKLLERSGRQRARKQRFGFKLDRATRTGLQEHAVREDDLQKVIEPLAIYVSITTEDKVLEASALHARWKVEDREGDALCNDEVVFCRRERCKDIARIIFGHTVHDQQVDAIYTIFYEERDLLLLAKTALGRILSFNYFPFMCYHIQPVCYYSDTFGTPTYKRP